MTKWDSHTHSQFCRHGSREDTALMVERAITLGFTRYSISDHAPLPESLIQDPEIRSEFSLLENEMEDYFDHITELKMIYGDRIEILSGLEIDYLSGFEAYTFDLIRAFENRLDDLIISLHCIEGKGGLRSVDYTPADFKDGLHDHYGSIDAVHTAYWEFIQKMVETDFGFPKAKRLGHIGLINKFSHHFPEVKKGLTTPDFLEKIFKKIKSKNWSLEFNAAGMSAAYNGNAYLTETMLFLCKKLNIEVLYGSDAHGIRDVGRYYNEYLEALSRHGFIP